MNILTDLPHQVGQMDLSLVNHSGDVNQEELSNMQIAHLIDEKLENSVIIVAKH